MEKKEMQVLVRKLLKKNRVKLAFSTKDKAFDDAADALALAIHHAWKIQGRKQIVLNKKDLDAKKAFVKKTAIARAAGKK